MMILMVGLFGCEKDVAAQKRGERVALLGVDHMEVVEVYCSVECVIDKRVFSVAVPMKDDLKQYVIYVDAADRFNVSFDTYTVDTGQFIKSISIDSADYEYGEFILIKNL